MRVSIITVTLDAGAALAATAASVTAQRQVDWEWVVIDGGSHDRSLDGLAPYRDRIACLVSEPDGGIADAMNKGLARATGEAVVFMNAGDRFSDATALATLAARYRADRPWVVGGAHFCAGDGRILFQRLPPRHPTSRLFRNRCGIVHQAVLLRRQLLIDLGCFDPRWRTCFDYAIWLQLWNRGWRPETVQVPTCHYLVAGASGNAWRRYLQESRIRRRFGWEQPLIGELITGFIAWTKSALHPWRENAGLLQVKERLRC